MFSQISASEFRCSQTSDCLSSVDSFHSEALSMEGGDSPEKVQRIQDCSLNFRQIKVKITIRNVTSHWDILDDLEGAAIADISHQPLLNHSPLHSLFTENASPKQSTPPTASIFNYADEVDDFDLLDWAPGSIEQPPKDSNLQQQALLAYTSQRSRSTTIRASLKPIIASTSTSFDDFVDLDTFDWTPMCDVHRHENPDTLQRPPDCGSGYMYNSLEHVDLDDLWPKPVMSLQQASVIMRPTHSNLPLISIPEPAAQRLSHLMDKSEGLQLLPGTSESAFYQQQIPGIAYNYAHPYQMVNPGRHLHASNMKLRQMGQSLPQNKIPQEFVNSHVSSQWYRSSQISDTSPINLHINLHGKPINVLHPQEMQARNAQTHGHHSASAGPIYSQSMMGNLVAGVSTTYSHKGERVLLEDNQPMKIQRSGASSAADQKIPGVPHSLHQTMLVNALPHTGISAVNVTPTFTHLPSVSDNQPVPRTITGHLYRPEGIQLLQQAPGNVVYLQQNALMPPTYRQPFHLVGPSNHSQIANMKFIQLGEPLPPGWIPLQLVKQHVPPPWYGPGPFQLTNACPANMGINLQGQPFPKASRQSFNKPHPEKIQAEDSHLQGQLDPLNKQQKTEKPVSGASPAADYPEPQEREGVTLEDSQSLKKQKLGVAVTADRNAIGLTNHLHQSQLESVPAYSAKSAVNMRPTHMNTTSSSGMQPITRSVSSHMLRPEAMWPLQGASGSPLNLQQIAGMPPNYTQPYQMLGFASQVSKMKSRQLGEQLPLGWMPLQTVNPCVSTPWSGHGHSQLTEVNPANLNISSHRQPHPTDNRQLVNTPHPGNSQAKDNSTAGEQATVKSTSASNVSGQHQTMKLLFGASTASGHPAPQKGEVVILEERQPANSEKSGVLEAADRSKSGDAPVQNPAAVTHSPSPATQTTQEKECAIQHADKLPSSIGPTEEGAGAGQPSKQTNNLFGAKAQLNMRMRESVAILHKLGDKGEGSIAKHASDVAPRKALGNSAHADKAKQRTHKNKVYGEGALSGDSKHTGNSTTKRKKSDSLSPRAKKIKNQIGELHKSSQKTDCVTLGHDGPCLDAPLEDKPKEVQSPGKDKNKKQLCKHTQQDCFKHPRSQLTKHMLESVEVFHKLGGKPAHVPRKPAIPISTQGGRHMIPKVCRKSLSSAHNDPIPLKKAKYASIQGSRRMLNPRLLAHRSSVHRNPAAAFKMREPDARKEGSSTQTQTDK